MKHLIQKAALLFAFATFSQAASAGIPIFFEYGGEEMAKVIDLPDTDDYLVDDNEYLDIGVLYAQVKLFMIPIWNYDVRWVGTGTVKGSSTISDEYYMLSATDIDGILAGENLTLPSNGIPFWDRFGGKLLVLLIIIGTGIWIAREQKNEESEDDDDKAQEEKNVA